ncbi:late competence development ComFB family protein [Pseudoflavonifractor phocaeensis]|uniref:late competence development ComFB family protein n=1 Tax=Pseudoflavonifractor phocaeensis TaxID=1870988 RepID=UPI00195B6090|nr:late competence development ComFB family protein [Pseudoflavonifractor phocaeensis]MBM6887049.1 late competence development ComFB family protein [Pseudoflavonifractor phocaeensis]
MAGKKNGRSSKTDHVLSLLAGGGASHEASAAAKPETAPASSQQASEPSEASQPPKETRSEPVQTPAAGVPSGQRRVAPPILEVARVNNEALSETIREALTESLNQELAQAEPEPEPELLLEPEVEPKLSPEPKAEPEPEPGPTLRPEIASEPEAIPAPEPRSEPEVLSAPKQKEELEAAHAPMQEPEPATVQPLQPEGPGIPLPDGAVYLNVMEELVEEPLRKYIKLFGLCDCPRCVADVRALALSRLPAKYVVLSRASLSPLLSFYQAKFDSALVTQVIYACKTVMESPRHTL